MKSKLTILFILLSSAKVTLAQENTWDVAATEIMISHNKQNFTDHKDASNNQVISQATVSTLKKSTNEFKKLSDFIDQRLTTAFIVAADASTVYSIFRQLSEMVEYQKKSLQIVKNHPWAAGIMATQQEQILKSGNDLVNYLSLIVLSYGQISKMKVSSRKVIFHSIDLQVSVLKVRCYSLYNMMKRLDLTSQIRNTRPMQLVNKDQQIIKSILKNIK